MTSFQLVFVFLLFFKIQMFELLGLYYIDYTLQNPGESRRYIYSAIGMANNGWYNRLYTVTGQVSKSIFLFLQSNFNLFTWLRALYYAFLDITFVILQFMEEEADKYASKIQKVSFSYLKINA